MVLEIQRLLGRFQEKCKQSVLKNVPLNTLANIPECSVFEMSFWNKMVVVKVENEENEGVVLWLLISTHAKATDGDFTYTTENSSCQVCGFVFLALGAVISTFHYFFNSIASGCWNLLDS